MTRPIDIPHDDWVRILTEIMDDSEDLLAIPGVYELVSEHYNNDIIACWQREQESQ